VPTKKRILDGLTKGQRYRRRNLADPTRRARANERERTKYKKGKGERRAERRFRHRSRRNKEETRFRNSGISIVTAKNIRQDDTYWRGPGMLTSHALEIQADQILKEAGFKQ